MEKKTNNVPVFIKALATQLMKMGFPCLDEVPNYSKEGYSVFYFEDTEEVRCAIKEISLQRGRKVFKIRNRQVSNELLKRGYELLNIRSTQSEGIQYIYKWTDTIYDESVKIRKELYE